MKYRRFLLSGLFLLLSPIGSSTQELAIGHSAETPVNRDQVKIAAVQISGYDKGDPRREGYDAADDLVPYIHRAGRDDAQLVVFPEYILGRIAVPGATTAKIAAAAASQHIYVIVGCWEVYETAGSRTRPSYSIGPARSPESTTRPMPRWIITKAPRRGRNRPPANPPSGF